MAEQQPFGDVELATNPEPRCPCVLLLDVSGSMAEIVGEPGQSLGYTVQQDGQTYQAVSGGVTRIDKVNEGLRAYHTDLMGGPHPAFFRPLFDGLRNSADAESLGTPFRAFLDSPRVNDRTDDDKTLVLAVRRA